LRRYHKHRASKRMYKLKEAPKGWNLVEREREREGGERDNIVMAVSREASNVSTLIQNK